MGIIVIVCDQLGLGGSVWYSPSVVLWPCSWPSALLSSLVVRFIWFLLKCLLWFESRLLLQLTDPIIPRCQFIGDKKSRPYADIRHEVSLKSNVDLEGVRIAVRDSFTWNSRVWRSRWISWASAKSAGIRRLIPVRVIRVNTRDRPWFVWWSVSASVWHQTNSLSSSDRAECITLLKQNFDKYRGCPQLVVHLDEYRFLIGPFYTTSDWWGLATYCWLRIKSKSVDAAFRQQSMSWPSFPVSYLLCQTWHHSVGF